MKQNSILANNEAIHRLTIKEDSSWFPIRRRVEVKHVIEQLKSQNVSTLRLGIDCTTFNTKRGLKWYNWLIPTLAENFTLELSFDNFTTNPESLGTQKYSLPEIVEYCIHTHSPLFNLIELRRDPSNRTSKKENSENLFSEDVVFTATWAKHLGKKVILGDIQTCDFDWITKLVASGIIHCIEYLRINKWDNNFQNMSFGNYEKTLSSLFQAKGVRTEIRTNATPLIYLGEINRDNVD